MKYSIVALAIAALFVSACAKSQPTPAPSKAATGYKK